MFYYGTAECVSDEYFLLYLIVQLTINVLLHKKKTDSRLEANVVLGYQVLSVYSYVVYLNGSYMVYLQMLVNCGIFKWIFTILCI